MNLPLTSDYLHGVCLAMANSAIHITLLFGGGFALAAWSRRSAAARHAIWLCTLIAMMLTPIVALVHPAVWLSFDLPVLATGTAPRPAPPWGTKDEISFPSPFAEHAATREVLPVPTAERTPDQVQARIPSEIIGKRPSAPEAAPAPPVELLATLETILFGVWLFGVLMGLLWLALGWRRLARMRTEGVLLVGGAQAGVLERVRARLNASALPPIAWTTEVDGPVTIGIFRPLVLLPAGIDRRLSEDQLCDVLTHECAHVLRRDPLVGLVQRIAGIVFWPHPLVHYLNGQLARAREELCDNHVLLGRGAAEYSQMLLKLSLALTRKHRPLMSHGMLSPRWNLEHRVRGLLDKERKRAIRIAPRSRFVLIVLVATASLLVAGIQVVARAASGAPPAKSSTPANPRTPAPPDDDTVRQWIEQVGAPDPEIRLRAVQNLRRVGARAAPAIPALVALLADEKQGNEAKQTLARIGKPAVPALIEALRSDNESVRWWAAQAIEMIGPSAEAAIDALIASFDDTDHPLKNAPGALAGMGTLALPKVMGLLADPNSSASSRVRAANAIWSMGPRAKPAVPLLIEMLKDRRKPDNEGLVSVREAAISALGAIGSDASGAAPAIASLLRDEERYVRQSSAEALGEMGLGAAPAIPALIMLLKDEDEDEEVSVRAAQALGNIGPPAQGSAEAIVGLLIRLDGEVNTARRAMVSAALGRIGPGAAPAVLAAYRSAAIEDRPPLITALGQIGAQNNEVLGTIISAIDSDDGTLRLAALNALNPTYAILGPEMSSAKGAVIKALEDPNWQVRGRAAMTLSCMSPRATEAIPALAALLDDSEFQVREEAVWALLFVGSESGDARQAMESATKDREKRVRIAAVSALERIRANGPEIDRAELLRARLIDEFTRAFGR